MANRTVSRGGRPLGFDPDRSLDQIVEAFWVHGYDATTTTILEEATGLSRSSLLNTFGSKEQLLLAAIDRYQSAMDGELLDPMLNGERGLADLDHFFAVLGKLKTHAPGSSGCLIVNVGSLPELTPELRHRVDRYHRRLRAAISAAITRAADLGELDRTRHATQSNLLVATAVAINWMARAQGPEAARKLANATRRQLSDWVAGPA